MWGLTSSHIWLTYLGQSRHWLTCEPLEPIGEKSSVVFALGGRDGNNAVQPSLRHKWPLCGCWWRSQPGGYARCTSAPHCHPWDSNPVGQNAGFFLHVWACENTSHSEDFWDATSATGELSLHQYNCVHCVHLCAGVLVIYTFFLLKKNSLMSCYKWHHSLLCGIFLYLTSCKVAWEFAEGEIISMVGSWTFN